MLNTLKTLTTWLFFIAIFVPAQIRAATISGPGTVCGIGTSTTYTYTSSPSVSSVVWGITTGVDGTDYIIAASGLTVTITWLHLGTYDVTAGTASPFHVKVAAIPNPAISADVNVGCLLHKEGYVGEVMQYDPHCDQVCENSTVTYQTPLNSGSIYSWSEIGAVSASPSGASCAVLWGPAASITQVMVTETTSDGCVASAQLCVKGVNTPHAVIGSLPATVAGTIYACANTPIQFSDLSTISATTFPPPHIESEYWDFGDMGFSSDHNPTHTYSTAGSYTVTMRVKSECGCEAVTSVNVVISSAGPQLFCPTTKCHDDTATYYTNAVCATYNWHITNGTFVPTPSTTDNTVHVVWGNGNSGPGVISLSTPSCSGSCTTSTSATIPILPTIPSITGPSTLCAGQEYVFDAPMVPSTIYNWELIPPGAGTIYVQDYETKIILNGTISSCVLKVTMTNTFYHCSGTSSIPLSLRLPAGITTTAGRSFCQGANPSFTAGGTGGGYSGMQWHIEDASGATLAGTSYTGATYTPSLTMAPGTYLVVAVDPSGSLCASRVTTQIVVNATPGPLIAISPVSCICPGLLYTYSATPSDPTLQLQWTASGASGGTQQQLGNSISVTWASSGPLSVSVSQIGPDGCASPSYSTTINRCSLPTGSVSGPSSPCENTDLTYTAPVTDGDNYHWQISPPDAGVVLGSGTNPWQANIHWNALAASYSPITISVTVIRCGATATYTQTVTPVATPVPTVTANNLCNNNPLSFSTSTGSGATVSSYAWSIDGSAVTGASSSTLTTTAVTATNVGIGVTVTYNCPSTPVNMSNTANFNVLPGPHVNVDPVGNAHICSPATTATLIAVVTNATSPTYAWSNAVSTATNTVSSTGTYTVTVTAGTCTAVASKVVDTYCPGGGCTQWTGSPAPSFTAGTPSCSTVNFSSSWSGSPSSVLWDFGDPGSNTNTGTTTAPQHRYTRAGVFTVTMTVSYTGYCDIHITHTVTINTSMNLNYGNTCIVSYPYGNVVTITNLSSVISGTPTYTWGSSVSGTAGTNTYTITPTSGTPSSATVTVTEPSSGCSATISVPLPYIPTPTLAVPTYSNCADYPIILNAGTVPLGISTIHWNWPYLFGTGPIDTFTMYDSRLITLDEIDIYGCHHDASATLAQYVNNFMVAVSNSSTGNVCAGTPIALTATPTLVPPATSYHPSLSYAWSNGPSTATDVVTASSNYTVTVTDGIGCQQTATGGASFTSVPTPPLSGPLVACLNTSVTYATRTYPTSSGYTYQWSVNGVPVAATGSTYTFTPTSGTSVTVSLTMLYTSGTFTCSSAATSVVTTLYAVPAAPTVTFAGNKCVDAGPVPLTASGGGAADYHWNTGQVGSPVSVYYDGVYTVYYIDGHGCRSGDGSITVKPGLGFDRLIRKCLFYCKNSDPEIVMPDIPENTYTWHTGSITGTPTYTGYQFPIPSGGGVFYLHIQNTDNCQGDDGPIDIYERLCGNCCRNGVFQVVSISCTGPGSPNCTWKFDLSYHNPDMSVGDHVDITIPDTAVSATPGTALHHIVTSTDLLTHNITFSGNATGPQTLDQICFDLTHTLSDGSKCTQEVCTFVSCP